MSLRPTQKSEELAKPVPRSLNAILALGLGKLSIESSLYAHDEEDIGARAGTAFKGDELSNMNLGLQDGDNPMLTFSRIHPLHNYSLSVRGVEIELLRQRGQGVVSDGVGTALFISRDNQYADDYEAYIRKLTGRRDRLPDPSTNRDEEVEVFYDLPRNQNSQGRERNWLKYLVWKATEASLSTEFSQTWKSQIFTKVYVFVKGDNLDKRARDADYRLGANYYFLGRFRVAPDKIKYTTTTFEGQRRMIDKLQSANVNTTRIGLIPFDVDPSSTNPPQAQAINEYDETQRAASILQALGGR